MSRSSGHYSGWVKRESLKRGFAGPIGMTTTPEGHRVVAYPKPTSINARKLDAVLDTLAKRPRGARA